MLGCDADWNWIGGCGHANRNGARSVPKGREDDDRQAAFQYVSPVQELQGLIAARSCHHQSMSKANPPW